MTDNQMYSDTLSGLKEGMKALKDNLPESGVISDMEIRGAMQKKSAWLKKLMWGEIIVFPLAGLILLSAGVYMHMNLWCVYTILIVGFLSLLLDIRTISVPQKWIQEDSLVELSRKLVKQKLWRKRQNLWEAPLAAVWCVWFMYEYLRNLGNLAPGIGIPEEYFYWVWGILSVAMICLVAVIVIYIYRKAQRINDEMIRNIDSFTEG